MIWTKEEVELLLKHYPYESIEQLNLLLPNRTCSSLRIKASNLGIKKKIICNPNYQQWSKEEVDRLMEKYPVVRGEDLCKLFPNRTAASINLKAYNIGIKKKYIVHPYVNGDLGKLMDELPISYYWMGFLTADGHFGRDFIMMALSIKDKLQIAKLAEFIGCDVNMNAKKAIIKVQDKHTVPLIKSKFNLHHRKTYNPMDVGIIRNMDDKLFESWVIGFVDGDGHLRKQPKRNDSIISIKLHSSWLNVLQTITNKLYDSLRLHPPKAKINNSGYANVHWGHWEIIRKLLSVVEDEKLPALERKWSIIDKSYEPKYICFKKKREKVLQLFKKDYPVCVVAEMLGVSGAYVYKVKKELKKCIL